ncbi:MAG: polysaccharide deacetylase family protein [Candidatus Omnitrophica bacterium]|nr:polysaccharide deacetylase family protein [Candidatus Omnitrophota bacterium]MBU1925266.1 polysaccharide deacetylase family protein [Candidatus Omnitrophota bacterium]
MFGTVQVDVDGLWTYYRYLGREFSPPDELDPVYGEGVFNFLELFKKHSIKATFFIVGRDAVKAVHKNLIQRIVGEGHEIANHTLHHRENFCQLPDKELSEEIDLGAEKIKEAGGIYPVGFRAPIFSVNERVLKVLISKEYLYDASLLPSFFASFALQLGHSLWRRQNLKLKTGRFSFGLAPLAIYRPDSRCLWKSGSEDIWEVPVSVMPYLRLPLHSSYAFLFGKRIFDLGFNMLRKSNAPLSYLFHGLDLVDFKKYNLHIPFFRNFSYRNEICRHIMNRLKSAYELMPTKELVERSGGQM